MIRVALLSLLLCLGAPACMEQNEGNGSSPQSQRDNIRIVGSSTVFPFSAKTAQEFRNKADVSVVVEATGSGGGHKLFCSDASLNSPDIVNSSRRQKKSEIEACRETLERPPFEIALGKDGIVLGQLVERPMMDVSLRTIYLSLAETVPASESDCTPVGNPYRDWNEIDGDLPERPILFYGPPPTSGTRDTFAELVMQAGARQIQCLADLEQSSPEDFRQRAETLREDGRWIDSGENDNTIIQTLLNSPNAIGLFGYSFLEQNRNRVSALSIGGVLPSAASIRSEAYPISRPLYVYVKTDHLTRVPPLRAFVAEMLSDDAIGADGYLTRIGLVPVEEAILLDTRAAFERLATQ